MKRAPQVQFWTHPPATNKYLHGTFNHHTEENVTVIIVKYNWNVPGNWKEHTSDFASSIAEAIASNAARPSMNHWARLPSSVKPLGGAKEPKRWGWHQPSGGLSPASLMEATQSLTLELLFTLKLMLRLPQATFQNFTLFIRRLYGDLIRWIVPPTN